MCRRLALALAVVAVLLPLGGGACLESATLRCADGRICPAGTVCDDAHAACVQPDQLASCAGLADGVACAFAGVPAGRCREGVCAAEGCGDGFLGAGEQCDGDEQGGVSDCRDLGYYEPGPVGCTVACVFDTAACARLCGDRVPDPEEQCDALGTVRLADCTELGFYDGGDVTCTAACTYNVSGCTGRCGDGVTDEEEICDGADPVGSCLDYGYDAGHLGCSPFCVPGFAGCLSIGWSRVLSSSSASHTAIWGSATGDVFVAAGDEVLRRRDGAWVADSLGSPAYGLWGSGSSDVHAVGLEGAIWRFDGADWFVARPRQVGAPTLRGVSGSGPSDVVAVGDQGTLLRFDGTTWTELPDLTGTPLRGVWAAGPAVAFAVGSGVAVRLDGGTRSVDALPSWDLHAVWGTSPTDVYAVGMGGAILHFDGDGWSPQESGTTAWLRTVWGTARDELFVAGDGGVLLRHDGTSWWPLESGTGRDLLALGGHGREVLAGGAGGMLLARGAADWSMTEVPGYQDHVAVWAGGDDEVYVATECEIRRHVGSEWIQVGPYCTEAYAALWSAPGVIVATDLASEIVRLDAAGASVDVVPGYWLDVWASGPDDILVVGDQARVGRWDGVAWTQATVGAAGISLTAVWGSGAGDAYAVGMEQTGEALTSVVFHGTDAGWARVAVPDVGPLTAVWGSGPNDVYAVGGAGAVLHWDGGAWSPVDVGVSVDLLQVSGTAPDDVFLAGASGTLVHWDGVAWAPVRAPSDRSFLGLSVSPTHLLLVDDGQSYGARTPVMLLLRHGSL